MVEDESSDDVEAGARAGAGGGDGDDAGGGQRGTASHEVIVESFHVDVSSIVAMRA